MKVYVQTKNHVPFDYDAFNAVFGFMQRGFEIVPFENMDELRQGEKCDVIVGGIGVVNRRLHDFGLRIEDVDYPECLSEYLGRRIWKSTINTVNANPDMWPVFIKSVSNKRIKGRVVASTRDLIGCGSEYSDEAVYCSEVLELVAEYRAFILYDEILDVRRYSGRWDICPDREVVEACREAYVNAPKAYAMDFGITADGRTVLVEVNNTCSIGSYGLEPTLYAKFISARWAELTDTQDECRI